MELRGDEDLLARDAAGADGGAHRGLVPVALRRVDVAVAGFERRADRSLAVGALGELPDAEAEPWEVDARCDGDGAAGCGRRTGRSAHGGSVSR
jgi:hypothetical protein